MKSGEETEMKSKSVFRVLFVLTLALTFFLSTTSSASKTPPRDFRAEAKTYIGYYNTIKLKPEQEGIKNAALTRIPAPCCSDNSIATCCCPCNLAQGRLGSFGPPDREQGL
jgi:hypothetical protein